MPAKSTTKKSAVSKDIGDIQVVFICGEDDFAVERRAREVLAAWNASDPDNDFEEIDGRVSNTAEAMAVLGRFSESIQTPPFLAPHKIIHLKKCSFLGEDRTSSSKSVSDFVASLPDELTRIPEFGDNIKVLWTAGKVDKRKAFYKSIGKAVHTEVFDGWNTRSRNWQNDARQFIIEEFSKLNKTISPKTADFLVEFSGSSPRQMAQEIEKICLYAGEETTKISEGLIQQIAVRNKEAEAFALAESLGSRNLAESLHLLDREVAAMAADKSRSFLAILYSLVSKIRNLIYAKALIEGRVVRPGLKYYDFKDIIESLPDSGGKFGPKSAPVYGLYLSYEQCGRYSMDELIRSQKLLLECNRQLVSSGADPQFILQSTLIGIINQT